MNEQFWKVLFNPNEQTCFAATVHGTGVVPVEVGMQIKSQFFSINPMEASRKDSNVTSYRNILLEFDHLPPAQQLAALKTVPYSTLVWSGNKSYHAIIALEEPCLTRTAYDALVRRIYAIVPGVDASVKNPSRLSRCPGVWRDGGTLQTLEDVVCRRSNVEIDAWLGPLPESVTTLLPRYSLGISPWTRYFLAMGAAPGKRNAQLFSAACDMLRHGYSESQIHELVSKVLDLTEREINTCIRSAASTVARD